MKVTFLGSNGWIPNQDETSCFMVEHKDHLFLLDAGTGTSNLSKYASVLSKYDTITVILSHYHLDHIVGLIYLLPHIKEKKLRIYGPGFLVYDKSTQCILEELLNPTIFSRPLPNFCNDVQCFDYEGKDFWVDDVFFSVKVQQHSAPSFRITIDNTLIYATDTVFNASEWQDDFSGMVLLHECWDITSCENTKHTTLKSLIDGLPKELLDTTYLIHKNPCWTIAEQELILSLIKGTGILIARDDMIIEI